MSAVVAALRRVVPLTPPAVVLPLTDIEEVDSEGQPLHGGKVVPARQLGEGGDVAGALVNGRHLGDVEASANEGKV